jgi:hypothetical protein
LGGAGDYAKERTTIIAYFVPKAFDCCAGFSGLLGVVY